MSNTKNKERGCLRSFAVLLFVAVLATVIGGFFYLWQWDDEKSNLPVPDQAEGNTLRPLGDEVLFLVAGVDDTGPGTAKRTDTLMLFRMNFTERKLVGLSIPRDTRVYIEGELDKINAAYAYGGIEETMSTIRRFLGIDLDYYVVVDFETIRAMVDATGGIRYEVPEEAQPVEGEIYVTGEHQLDGEEALSYLRHRQGYQNGDLDRVNAQQDFLKEMVAQMVSPSHIVRLPLVMHAFRSHAQTNLPFLPMMPHAFRMAGFRVEDIEMDTIQGYAEYIDGVSYYLPSSEEVLDQVENLFAPYVE